MAVRPDVPDVLTIRPTLSWATRCRSPRKLEWGDRMTPFERILSLSTKGNKGWTGRYEVARWGWISPAGGERLPAHSLRHVAIVRLSPNPTVRSLGQAILEIFEEPGLRDLTTSHVWSEVYRHLDHSRLKVLIFTGGEHLPFGHGAEQSANSFELREALKALLDRRIGIVWSARRTNFGFVLKDSQHLARCVGSLNTPRKQLA